MTLLSEPDGWTQIQPSPSLLAINMEFTLDHIAQLAKQFKWKCQPTTELSPVLDPMQNRWPHAKLNQNNTPTH